jgi:hypothetical protein
MIALTENGDEQIQITSPGGDLGITSPAEALAYRLSAAYRDRVLHGTYGLNPVRWSIGHFGVPHKLAPDYLPVNKLSE